jgi:hypothetical protein
MQLCKHVPQKGWWDTGLCMSSQTVGSLLRTLWPAKPAGKIWQKVSLMNAPNGKINSTTFVQTQAKN